MFLVLLRIASTARANRMLLRQTLNTTTTKTTTKNKGSISILAVADAILYCDVHNKQKYLRSLSGRNSNKYNHFPWYITEKTMK